MSGSGHLLAELRGEQVGEREERFLVPFVGGISEHETLISSSEIFFFLFSVSVDGVGNVLILSFDVEENVHGLVIETLVGVIITDLFADLSGNSFVIDLLTVDGDFTEKTDLEIDQYSIANLRGWSWWQSP